MIKFKTNYTKMISDRLTPVSLYLTIRDKFPMSFLLESSDYHGQENSFSYLCFKPIAEFSVDKNKLKIIYPDKSEPSVSTVKKENVVSELNNFKEAFSYEKMDVNHIYNGLFGYMAYDAVNYFEDIDVRSEEDLPAIDYKVFQYVIAIDHFHNELHIYEHLTEGEESQLDEINGLINRKDETTFPFNRDGEELSFTSDSDYLEMVKKGIEHCHRGDVFQVVLSRRFGTHFTGDEFNVYRALRSVNPSPYLFYFDYGNYKIFGSSPEAQLVVNKGKASIYPIAGTFKRTGKDAEDAELARQLAEDKKENSEHVMLVDLARNDLSRRAEDVQVDVFKEIQFYSHVIHLVSQVTGKLKHERETLELAASTFPAGTLSGAPKYRAMQLIDQYETRSRGYYGGAVGFMSFDGDFNHAIMIRSFFSRSNMLYYQAGAGVVANSKPHSELQEVTNKLGALRKALKLAENI